ncbi:Beta-apo-4'-carotenal oxygenase [Escovopsis weberi]|uniref:Aldehyde dehydrogenase n=1 Tax=Escovopsis weberi TaxID=150374 RepID=A0A0M8N419_ESCWE|nr:Beta-apo-4'-carotenal oxygenase [Escovopsis weberi]
MALKGELAEFTPFDIEQVTPRLETLRASFRSNKTKDVEFRLRQLRKLYWAIRDNEALIHEALRRDLGKSKVEASMAEIDWCAEECMVQIKGLPKWSRDEKIPDLPLLVAPATLRIRNEPLGTVLVIGAFNFPFQLSLAPVIGAIGAGNTVVLKPPELAPWTSMAIKKVMDDSLDPDCYVCMVGGLNISKHLLEHKFDKIAFTGGRRTGTIVAKKAAETLTPVLLELGGLNPAFVTRSANIPMAGRRLLWQKCMAAGQLCVSHNYALVERSVVDAFVEALKVSYRDFFPAGARDSPDYSRIGYADHFHRLRRMLEQSSGKVVLGGGMDEADRFFEPTVVLVEDPKDSLIVDETFGPIWSIVPYDSLDDAIELAREIDPTPLALYVFGNEAENDKVLKNITSGGATFNDGFTHGIPNAVPFGGVGTSGSGAYRGRASFREFSHRRCIAKMPFWADALMRVRYMPYLPGQHQQFRRIGYAAPNFDRNGDVVKGLGYWASFVLTLGAKRASGAAARWAILLLTAFALKLRETR